MPENLLITIGTIMLIASAYGLQRVIKAHLNDVRYNKKLNRK